MRTTHTFDALEMSQQPISTSQVKGVFTMDMRVCVDETGAVFSWEGQRRTSVSLAE